jgi:hypothetical protein
VKLITSILLTILLAFAIGLFEFPWWSFAVTTIAVFAAIPQHPGKSFLAGFISIFCLWAVLALKIDIANEHLLSQKVASILPFKGNYTLLILVTATVGGLVAGFSATTGSLLRKALVTKKKKEFKY